MKKMLICFLVICFFSFGSAFAASTETVNPLQINRLGVIDLQVITKESPKLKSYQEELNIKGKELNERLEIEKANLSPEELQMRQQAAYNEFLRVKKWYERQFEQILQQVLAEVAKEKDITVILYKNVVAFGGIDITQDVINKMQ